MNIINDYIHLHLKTRIISGLSLLVCRLIESKSYLDYNCTLNKSCRLCSVSVSCYYFTRGIRAGAFVLSLDLWYDGEHFF